MFFSSDKSRPLLEVKRENGAALADEFRRLLAEKHPEQVYQEFIERHTQLVPRDFEQNHGVHHQLVFRKLPFGADYVSDLFFLSKSSDDWNCVFIELESPHANLFRGSSDKISSQLSKGIDQIDDWRAWLSKSANLTYFAETTVGFIRKPLGSDPAP